MSTVSDVIQTLMDMGFSEEKVKLALGETSWKGVEPAMEWLLAHANDPEPSESKTSDEPSEGSEATESTEKPSPIVLTEEEKKEKLRKLEELRIQKRKEREEKEKASEIEREKKRISEGKILTSIRKSHKDLEMKKIADDLRREKMEKEKAKAQIRAEIEDDKRARREAAERRQNPLRASNPAPPKPQTPTSSTSTPAPGEYTNARLQIRLPNGSTLVQTFSAKEPLSAVRLYVSMNRKDNYQGATVKFMTSFPRKVFTEDDYQKPLESLELVPSAVLIVTK